MYKFFVFYEGRPEKPEEFDSYYLTTHLPILKRWPGVKKVVVNRGMQLNEGLYMVVEVTFDQLDTLQKALASPEREEAARDRLKFPNFYGTIRHQIMKVTSD